MSFLGEGMEKYIQNFVRECQVCQRNKGEIVKSSGLVQPLCIHNQIFDNISMELITRLPNF
jgi:hypothetical protein